MITQRLWLEVRVGYSEHRKRRQMLKGTETLVELQELVAEELDLVVHQSQLL